MLAVIKEESGHMTSKITKVNNNVSGMKLPKKRDTYAIGSDNNGYAYYNSVSDSIDDLYLYFNKYIVPKNLSRQEAAKFLEKNYSMQKGYANRLLKLI